MTTPDRRQLRLGHSHPGIVHGTPITGKGCGIADLHGSSFCVSFAAPEQIDLASRHVNPGGMLLLDNGAFSIWRAEQEGRELPRRLRFETREAYRLAFWRWANTHSNSLTNPNAIAIIPDVIGGTEAENWLEARWAIRGDCGYGCTEYPERAMFVWHLDESLAQLKRAALCFNFVGLGSCAQYDSRLHQKAYRARLREALAVLQWVEMTTGRRPWTHLLRGLGHFSQLSGFDSADSCNVAINSNRLRASHGTDRFRERAARVALKVATT